VILDALGPVVARYNMAKRKYIDWDSIEPIYREGNLSNCDICRQYESDHTNSQTYRITVTETAIRKQAKVKNWKKNLAGKVKTQIEENLVRDEVRDSNQKLSDSEIINKAAQSGSNIILRHRREIFELARYEHNLLIDLGLNEDEDTLKDRSIILKNITDTMVKRINLERQANNLDKDDADREKARIKVERHDTVE
jgi:hypothetical protein